MPGGIVKFENAGPGQDKKPEAKKSEATIQDLSFLPSELQEAFLGLPPQLRKKILKREAAKKEDEVVSRSSSRSVIHVATAEETKQFFEQWAREARHERNEWTEEEVEEMDQIEREIKIRYILFEVLPDPRERSEGEDPLEKLEEVLNVIWEYRGATEQEEKGASEKEKEIQKKLEAIRTEEKAAVAELDKIGSKKGLTRQNERIFEEKKRAFVEKFGMVWVGVGQTKPIPYGMDCPKVKEEADLRKELEQEKKKRNGMRSLSLLSEYFDATDFSVLTAEVLEDRFGASRWRLRPVWFKAMLDVVDTWHVEHESGGALKKTEELNPSQEKKQQKKIEHFWRLVDSIQRCKDYPETEPGNIKNMERELAVVIHILK